jgi:hypothetical protein
MGKMIDAQSIVVASVATGGAPNSPGAGTILRAVFWHSLALGSARWPARLAAGLCFPWVIPIARTRCAVARRPLLDASHHAVEARVILRPPAISHFVVSESFADHARNRLLRELSRPHPPWCEGSR